MGASKTTCTSCSKYLTEISSFTNNNSRKIWNGATFNYEDYVSDSDTLVTQDEFIALIDDENKSKYDLTDLDFANGKYLKLAIDTSETIYNIPLFGVTYNNVKKVVYNGNEVSKFMLNGGVVFEKSSSEQPSTGETWVLNSSLSFGIKSWSYNINFTSNGNSYSNFSYNFTSPIASYLVYGTTNVYDANNILWTSEAYRTITFSTAPTGDLLTWLQANGTKQ